MTHLGYHTLLALMALCNYEKFAIQWFPITIYTSILYYNKLCYFPRNHFFSPLAPAYIPAYQPSCRLGCIHPADLPFHQYVSRPSGLQVGQLVPPAQPVPVLGCMPCSTKDLISFENTAIKLCQIITKKKKNGRFQTFNVISDIVIV